MNDMTGDGHIMVRQAVEKLGLDVVDSQIDRWLEYLALLQKWNKTYNMTAITRFNDMLIKHLFDSLSVASFITGERIADVGTGGGLPGIPLAILYPQKSFTLIDSVGKKVRFLNHAKKALQLDNLFPIHTRVETYLPDQKFDQVISRAFSSVSDFYALTKHLLKEGGELIAMKGEMIEEDSIAKLPLSAQSVPVEVPQLEAKRHIIVLKSEA